MEESQEMDYSEQRNLEKERLGPMPHTLAWGHRIREPGGKVLVSNARRRVQVSGKDPRVQLAQLC